MSLAMIGRGFLALAAGTTLFLGGCGRPEAAQPQSPTGVTTGPTAAEQPRDELPPLPQPIKMKVSYGAISGSNMPLWIIKESGVFEKYGLDVEIFLAGGGPASTAALIAGETAFAESSATPPIISNATGGDMVMIMGFQNTLPSQVVVKPEIKSPQDLKGKVLGINRFGSASETTLKFGLKQLGLDPSKDVEIVQVTTDAERLAAMSAGRMDGTVLQPPTTLQARKLGFNVLLDMASMNIPYQFVGIVTTRTYLAQNRDTVRRFVRASVEGIKYAKTHPKESMATIGQYMKVEDQEVLQEAYDQYIGKYLPEIPYPTAEGVKAVIEEVSASIPQALELDPASLVDTSFLKELEDSGFIKRLYGR